MTSLVRQIEAALLSVFDDALGDDALVSGFRESTLPGGIKNSDGDGRPEVLVKVQPATTQSYGVQILEFQVSATVVLKWSDDPTIAAFDEVAAAVERVLMNFNLNENLDDMSAALTTENFRCDGFALTGGSDSVTLSSQPPTISTAFNFALKGAFLPDPVEVTAEAAPAPETAAPAPETTETTETSETVPVVPSVPSVSSVSSVPSVPYSPTNP